MGTNAAENPEIQLQIEEPQEGASYQGVANLRGWAVAPQALTRIEVYLDDNYQFDVPLGGNREDVATNPDFGIYPNADRAGYSMALNYANWTVGEHTLRLRAIDADGNWNDAQVSFSVVAFPIPYIVHPDQPGALDPEATKLRQAIGDPTAFEMLGFTVENASYDLRLRWRNQSQGFAIETIDPAGGASRGQSIAGSWGPGMYYTWDLDDPKLESIAFYPSGRYVFWEDDPIVPGVEIGPYKYDPATRRASITAIEQDVDGDCGFATSGNVDSIPFDALEDTSDGNYAIPIYEDLPVEGYSAKVQSASNPIVGAWGDGSELSIVFYPSGLYIIWGPADACDVEGAEVGSYEYDPEGHTVTATSVIMNQNGRCGLADSGTAYPPIPVSFNAEADEVVFRNEPARPRVW